MTIVNHLSHTLLITLLQLLHHLLQCYSLFSCPILLNSYSFLCVPPLFCSMYSNLILFYVIFVHLSSRCHGQHHIATHGPEENPCPWLWSVRTYIPRINQGISLPNPQISENVTLHVQQENSIHFNDTILV